MSVSGALFDGDKLNDVSKTCVSRLSGEEVYNKLTAWAKEFDGEFFTLLTRDGDYTKAMLSIDRDVPKPRKDIAKWNETKDYFLISLTSFTVTSLCCPKIFRRATQRNFLKGIKPFITFRTTDSNGLIKLKA